RHPQRKDGGRPANPHEAHGQGKQRELRDRLADVEHLHDSQGILLVARATHPDAHRQRHDQRQCTAHRDDVHVLEGEVDDFAPVALEPFPEVGHAVHQCTTVVVFSTRRARMSCWCTNPTSLPFLSLHTAQSRPSPSNCDSTWRRSSVCCTTRGANEAAPLPPTICICSWGGVCRAISPARKSLRRFMMRSPPMKLATNSL